jgi:ribonuclease HI
MIEIYTDGAYASSLDQGGACAVVVKENEVLCKFHEGFKYTTNNRMEICGMMLAIKYIISSLEKEFTIYTDSQYVLNTITKGWKKKANLEMWEVLDNLLSQIPEDKKINYVWVKGHDGNKFNDIADMWAVHESHMNNLIKDLNEPRNI